jgi:hypothetical protein
MPISRGEFENGRLDPGHLVVDFLLSNIDTAYTSDEVSEHLSSQGVILNEEDMLELLEDLEGRGRIKAKTRDGVLYYIYRRSIGFKPS